MEMKKKTNKKKVLIDNKIDSINKDKDVKYKRPSWDEYFLGIMHMVGTRGTCDRGRSGCVIVKNRRILTTGYVGSAIGVPHCDEVGHEMHQVINDDGHVSQHCIRTIHAETNAIAHAARVGIALDGATLYCKMTPCYVCAKTIVNSGIIRVVAAKDYHVSGKTKELFKQCGVALDVIDNNFEQYKNQ